MAPKSLQGLSSCLAVVNGVLQRREMCKRVQQSPCDKTVPPFLPLAPLNWMLNACLNDGICKTVFPKNKQTKSCWRTELFIVFYSTHEMQVNFLWYLLKKKDTREQSYLRVSVFAFRCSGVLLYNKARYRSGEQTVLGKGWKDPQSSITAPGDPLALSHLFWH